TTKEEVFDTLKDELRPEFLNRIDERIMFLPLTREEIKKIARLLLRKTEKMLARQGMVIKISDRALDWLAERGYDPQFGARPMKRVLQADLADELSKDLIAGNFVTGDTIYTDVGKDELVFSKDPFPEKQAAAEVDEEAAAEAKAVLEEKAKAEAKEEAEKAPRKRSRRSGKKKPETAPVEEPDGNVEELKKATQELLDATKEVKKSK
ncbi:MAG: type VI secretion system ATPase TssH, partial [Bacteroidota bacterium]